MTDPFDNKWDEVKYLRDELKRTTQLAYDEKEAHVKTLHVLDDTAKKLQTTRTFLVNVVCDAAGSFPASCPDDETTIRVAIKDGIEKERAHIVAWLRREPLTEDMDWTAIDASHIADALERRDDYRAVSIM